MDVVIHQSACKQCYFSQKSWICSTLDPSCSCDEVYENKSYISGFRPVLLVFIFVFVNFYILYLSIFLYGLLWCKSVQYRLNLQFLKFCGIDWQSLKIIKILRTVYCHCHAGDYKLIGESPKVKSLREAMGSWRMWLNICSENLMEMANNLSKILSNIQSTWLSHKLKVSVQSKVTDFFASSFKNSKVL